MGEYSLKIRSIHPLGVNGANLACKQNRKMVKSVNLLFAHWAFPSGCAIMLMLIETHTAGVKGGRVCTTDSQKSAGGIHEGRLDRRAQGGNE